MSGPVLSIRALEVCHGDVAALQGVSLEVDPGEALGLLGPSGSGKTTLLYAVAGFLRPERGEIEIGGERMFGGGADVPPERRRVGVVFQQYALWPHLSVLDNVAYPIRRRRVRASHAREEAARLLDRVGVGELGGRRPSELSGGQQQRVGLARALAREADLYLFDEPTAHLDAALRNAVQAEIDARRREVGAAAVYATHDAAEALATAHRIVLLREGWVVQSGTPQEVYEQPADLWAARLTGPASVLEVHVVEGGTTPLLSCGEGTVRVKGGSLRTGPARILVRPEWARLGGSLRGVVETVRFQGPHTDYRLATPGGELELRVPGPPGAAPGDRVGWTIERAWPLD